LSLIKRPTPPNGYARPLPRGAPGGDDRGGRSGRVLPGRAARRELPGGGGEPTGDGAGGY